MENTTLTKELFETRCYEAYQLQWMMSHGFSLADFCNIAKNIAKEEIGKTQLNCVELPEDVEPLSNIIRNRFLHLDGFDGSLYDCKSEFLHRKFLDEAYMSSLFLNMPDGNKLAWFYYENYVEPELKGDDKQPYWVLMNVYGKHHLKVWATDVEDAKEAAENICKKSDYGELEDSDVECIRVEDENGNPLFEG